MNLKIYLSAFAIIFCANWNGLKSQSFTGGCSIHFGSSTPLGLFSSSSYNDKNAGYAEVGTAFELSCFSYFKKRPLFGYSIGFYNQSYDVNELALHSSFQRSSPDIDFTLISGSWRSIGFLSGPTLNYRPSDRLRLNLGVQIGYFFASSPRLIFITENSFQYQTIEQESETVLTPAFGISTGLTYLITNRLLAHATVEFQNCYPSFEDVKRENTSTNYISTIRIDQPMSAINVKLGIGWAFKK
jgi:hypothetical protein